ncbi:MAG: iron-containing alcohol dehydrogenase [Clostridia bacterium]|nr:iron-containing alcohol dehydrogenase [Clostridia bacterium]
MSKIIFNSTLHLGVGSTHELAREIKNRHYEKAFVITDNGLIRAGVAQKVLNILVQAKIPSVLFTDVTPEATVRDVKNAYNELKRSAADFILAIGGGSPIDTAKAISVIANNPKYEDVVSLQGEKNNLNEPMPVIAVPTTAGSAAEVSKSFVVNDAVTEKNIICKNDKMLPVAVFIDADLMTTMPDIVTLGSGFDAFTHAVESLISKNANLFSKTLSKEAIRIVAQNLPLSYDEPENIIARENMGYAEYIAGLAYSNSGLGICHSMAHAISGKFGVPHGIALAMCLPAALKFNMYSESAAEYKFIAEALGVNTNGLSEQEVCRAAIRAVEKFRNDFNVPKHLSDYGVHEEDLDILALHAYEDPCTAGNPREVTVADIYMILKKLL